MVAESVSVRLDEADRARLEAMAERSGTSVSTLIAEAVHGYIELNRHQEQVIVSRLSLADQGAFATREQVEATFRRWGVDSGDEWYRVPE